MKKITGTKDILPEDSEKYRFLENAARNIFELYGYKEIRTPIFEATEVFTKSIGEDTDIIEKEMYSFKDKSDRNLTLRPEGTAGVARAYVENGFYKKSTSSKFYYIGQMFRAEKPQRGRFREFNQIGIEAIGYSNPAIDAELIKILISLFNKLNLNNFEVILNSVGCEKCRIKFKDDLKSYVEAKTKNFCDICKKRINRNPMRILDCKNEGCIENLKSAPVILDYICDDCKIHFQKVLDFLSFYSIKYTINKNLVRGLDYYTKTTFEIISTNLGSQNAIAAGGRYDNLIKDFGGPDISAIGFAIGVERLLDAIETENIKLCAIADRLHVFFATIGESAFKNGLYLMNKLRENEILADIDYSSEKSLKAKMRKANQLNVRYTVIIGEEEINKGLCILRDMDKSTQEEIKIEEDALLRRIKEG